MDHNEILVHATDALFGMQLGRVPLRTHPSEMCAGPPDANGKPYCCIHNPSDHHMVDWPLNWRADRGLMERLCPHGVGHPDPDDIAYKRYRFANDIADMDGIHGCDGCCSRRNHEKSST